MSKFKFPLQSDSFSIWDRIKVCLFLLNRKNKLTIGPKVKEFEDKWEEFSGAKTVATSSGSTANILLVETFLQTHGYDPKDVTVFIPSTTWASSVSCWTMRGCKVKFVDINLSNLCIDHKELEEEVAADKSKVKVLWPTALIGNVPYIHHLKNIAASYNCYLFADLCECTFGYDGKENVLGVFDMATTSFFWAHEINSIEGGMLFIKPEHKNYFDNSQMIRNHGLTRSMENVELKKKLEKDNLNIDPEFLFIKEGTNFRMSDLHAYFGLLDFKRIKKYMNHRWDIGWKFSSNLNSRFIRSNLSYPFCIPIIPKESSCDNDFQRSALTNKIKEVCHNLGFEYRPIISFIAVAPAYKHLAEGQNFPNSELLNYGIYVGLGNNLKEKDIMKLVNELNKL